MVSKNSDSNILLTKALPESEEHVMTLAKYWEERGLERGFERGLERGLEQSCEEIAIKLFQEGIDPLLIIKVTGLSETKVNELLRSIVH